MKTLKELNEKAWYRFSKVVFIALFSLSYLFLALFGLSEFGREYHPPFYPATIEVALNDPTFYKVSDYDKKTALSFMSNSFSTYGDNTTQFIEKIKRIDIRTKEIKKDDFSDVERELLLDTNKVNVKSLTPIKYEDIDLEPLNKTISKERTSEVLSMLDKEKDVKEESEITEYIGNGFIVVPRKNPIPQEGAKEKYIYASYHTRNMGSSFLYFLILTVSYVLLVEIIKRSFYYVAIGKLFPKE